MARLRFALSAIPPIGSPPEAEFHFALIERRVSLRRRAVSATCASLRMYQIRMYDAMRVRARARARARVRVIAPPRVSS
jgi:hypothetical protein